MDKLALQADLWYNERVNIVVSKDAVNTLRLANLLRRLAMDILPQDNMPRKRCVNPDCENPWLPATPDFFYFRKVTQQLNNQCKACVKRKNKAHYHEPEVRARVLEYSRLPEVQARHLESERKRSLRPDVIDARHIYQCEYRQRPEIRERRRTHSRLYQREYYSQPTKREKKRAYDRKQDARPERQAKKRVYSRERYHITQQIPEVRTRRRIYGRIYAHLRRANKKAVLGVHTHAQIQEQLKRQHYRCYYMACGRAKFAKKNGQYLYHIDHTFPLSRVVGTDIPANDMSYLVLACPHCNQSKNKKFPWEWPEGGRLL